MPFVSQAQRRTCHARNDPSWDCDKWDRHTPDKKLPERANKFKEWLQARNPQLAEALASKTTLAPTNDESPGPLPGLEGPFRFRNGRILYYDPKEGKYYDRGSDMYVDQEELMGFL